MAKKTAEPRKKAAQLPPPRLLTRVDTLLVDLDGTLLGNRNLPLSLDFATQAIGFLKKYGGWRLAARTLHAIQKEFANPAGAISNDLRVVELFASRMKLSVEEGRKVLREGVLAIFPSLKKHFYPMPGAVEFLSWAKDRHPLILATNPVWPREVIEMRVRWAGIDPGIFRDITDVRKSRACKPEKRYYQDILDQNGLKAEDCMLVGNEIKMDLPATQVGIRTYIVDPPAKTKGAAKKAEVKPAESLKAPVPAWRGSYAQLKALLETNPL